MRKSDRADEPGRESIVPLVRARLDLASLEAESGMKFTPDDRPIEEPLVADLSVRYAFDIDGAFQNLNNHDLGRLRLRPGSKELRALAVENLRQRLGEVEV